MQNFSKKSSGTNRRPLSPTFLIHRALTPLKPTTGVMALYSMVVFEGHALRTEIVFVLVKNAFF